MGKITTIYEVCMMADLKPNEKYLLTIEEANAYFSIGINKIRYFLKDHPELVVMSGNRSLIKRKAMERMLDDTTEL